MDSQEICLCPNEGCQNQRGGNGDEASAEECLFCLFTIGSSESRDRSLDRACANGKADSIDWKYHLVDAESFSTDGTGKIDAVEKTKDSGQDSDNGQKQGSCDKGMDTKKLFQRHKGIPQDVCIT